MTAKELDLDGGIYERLPPLGRLDRLPRGASTPPTLEAAALHGPAGGWAEAVQPFTEASVPGVLAATLAAFGSAAGRTSYVQVGPTRHHLNEFMLLVGPTASGRKGEAMSVGMRPIKLADDGWCSRVCGGFGSGEAVVAEVADPVLDGDGNPIAAGANDKRLLVHEGEFAQLLAVAARDGSILSALIRNAWDGQPLQNRTKGRKAVATGAHVSALAAITPDELVRRVPESDIANGFLNRFLLVATARPKLLPDPPPIRGDVEADYVRVLREALTFARTAGRLTRNEEANERWVAAYREELSVDRVGLAGAVCSRAEAHAVRLQLLYALLDRSQAITLDHVEAALAFWRYCEQSAMHVFGDRTGDPVVDALVDALYQAGDDGLTRTEIRDLFSRHNASRIERALAELRAGGLAYIEKETTRGRPIERWRCDRSDLSDQRVGK